MFALIKRCGGAVALAVLAACGGGGGDDDDGDSNSYAAFAAWENFIIDGGSWSGIAGNGTGADTAAFVATLDADLVADAAFPPTGVVYDRVQLASTLTRNGAPNGSGTIEYFLDAQRRVQGVLSRAPGATDECARTTTAGVPPASAMIGASGTLMETQVLANCTAGAAVVGTTATTWRLESVGGRPLFCIDSVQRNNNGDNLGSEKDCFEITTAGALRPGARVVLSLPGNPGFGLDARNY
jgi:hypothetical protein